MMNKYFSKTHISRADYVFSAFILLPCFFLFYQNDIINVGRDSLNYLFSKPLDFYENVKSFYGSDVEIAAPYPPSIYLIFAICLYPFKLLGVIHDSDYLPSGLVYWLKALTTIVYVGTSFIFYKIAKLYFPSHENAKYVTIAWLIMPLSIFVQIILSQYDIFYIALTLIGFLMFVRGRSFSASLFFGVAISFKYFPLFVFAPLLLFFEKRFINIILCASIFYLPTFIVDIIYSDSTAFIETVKNHYAIDRVFDATLYLGKVNIYLLLASFSVLCGLCYFSEVVREKKHQNALYIYLVSSILPVIFILPHPQWLMFCGPAIMLTSMLKRDYKKFISLDLIGMFFLIGYASVGFPNNIDAAMFRGEMLSLDLENSYVTAKLFNIFSNHSANVYLTGLWSYLVLQIILKRDLIGCDADINKKSIVDYSTIRKNFYIGLLLFLIPTTYSIYKDANRNFSTISVNAHDFAPGELLANKSFEQVFIAKGDAITGLQLFLATYARKNTVNIVLEIVDLHGNSIFRNVFPAGEMKDNTWVGFRIDNLKVVKSMTYKIRLTSPSASTGNAITWWASKRDQYAQGGAFVDGHEIASDFSFKITFSR